MEPASPDRRVPRYVGVVAGLATVTLAASVALEVGAGALRLGWPLALGAAVFGVAFFVLGQTSFTFTWRGHRHRMVLDEIALYLGMLALPALLLPLLVGATSLFEQARVRRDRVKAVFNVAQNVVASGVAVATFVLLSRLGVAPAVAAIPAAFLHPLASNALLSGIFSRLTGDSAWRVFATRFAMPSLLAASVGVGGGVAVWTLWSVHPLTLLALAPFVFLTYRYGVLAAAADRELDVHKRLAEVAKSLVGTTDIERASRKILAACGDAFPSVGRAEIELRGASAVIAEDFGPVNPRAAPLVEPVPGDARVSGGAPGEAIGVLRLIPRRAATGVTEVEKALVRIVAAQLGAAIEEARALLMEAQARSRLEAYLTAAPDAILLVRDGRVSFANPAGSALFDLSPGDVARPIEELLPGLPAQAGLVELDLPERTVEVHSAQIEEGALLLVRDVTQRKRLEEESARQRDALSRQEKLSALGTLVAGVAHEINNPVTYMRGALELAKMDLEEVDAAVTRRSRLAGVVGESSGDDADAHAPAEDHRMIEHARAQLQRLAEGVDRVQKITHSLKSVARQGNGERAAEDVRAIAEDVVNVVRIGLPRGVRVDAELPATLARVHANPAELHQVVLNLVKNASEALAPQGGGEIRVRAWDDGRDVFVEVADDGPGIALDVQRRLFEPFFTTKRQGTGLGLSLSKGIIEAHGGDLLLDSAPGAGTRFTIRLPAMRE